MCLEHGGRKAFFYGTIETKRETNECDDVREMPSPPHDEVVHMRLNRA